MKFSTPLKKNYEFRRLYAKGRSAASSYAVVYCRKNKTQNNRLGITVGTKLGSAVRRNRIRRRFKEIYRLNEDKFEPGFDIVTVARSGGRNAPYRALEADFIYLCRKLGLLKQ